jgi:hypothetical protein
MFEIRQGRNKIAAAGLTQTLVHSLSSLRFSHQQLLGADVGALAVAWLREEKVAPTWAHLSERTCGAVERLPAGNL